MAKPSKAKPKAKKAKGTVDTVKAKGSDFLKEMNQKLKSSQKDLQKQVDELTKQLKKVKKEASAPAVDLSKSLEKKYKKQLESLRAEFDERIDQLHDMQHKVVEHLPPEVAEKLGLKKPTVTQRAKRATKAAASSIRKTAAKANNQAKKELAALKGVGPATLKKLQEAGITDLKHLTNPTKEQESALASFKNIRGSSSWKQQAQDLLSKS